MPLGRVYIPPPTTPIKYGSEFSFPNPQHIGNNKFSSKFNHINNNTDEETEENINKILNESDWFVPMLNISNTLVVLNSSINFYVYLLKTCLSRNDDE